MITSGKMGWVCPVCGAGNNPVNTLCGASCHANSIAQGYQKYPNQGIKVEGQFPPPQNFVGVAAQNPGEAAKYQEQFFSDENHRRG